MDMRRLFLFLIFSFSLVVLWSAWVRQNEPVVPVAEKAPTDLSIPTAPARIAQPTVAAAPAVVQASPAGKNIVVTTDIFKAEINTAGGNIQHLDLLKHKDTSDLTKPFTLLQQQSGHVYVAQSGLLGNGLPTHNAEFIAPNDEYHLTEGKDTVEVRLTAVESTDSHAVSYTHLTLPTN